MGFEPGKLGRFASSITQPLVIDGLEVVLWLARIELRDTTAADSYHETQLAVAGAEWSPGNRIHSTRA